MANKLDGRHLVHKKSDRKEAEELLANVINIYNWYFKLITIGSEACNARKTL